MITKVSAAVVLAATAALSLAPSASATAVTGSYSCSPYAGSGMLPADSSVTLTATGRYKFSQYGVNGGSLPGGRYSRKGSYLTFSGGALDRKHATFKVSSLFGRQLAFASLRGSRHICTAKR